MVKKYIFRHKKIFSIICFLSVFTAFLSASDFYWENPEQLTNYSAQFPFTISENENSYAIWQEIDTEKKDIYLTLRNYHSLTEFEENKRFAGPFKYSGDEIPNIYSVAVNGKGILAVAVLNGSSGISVYTSSNSGKSFEVVNLKTATLMIAPRIYSTHLNEFKLFTSVGEENTFTIFYSDSSDGKNWGKFEQFKPVAELRNPFLPYLISKDDYDSVVLQAHYVNPASNRFSYQLYITNSDTTGKNWSSPALISNEKSFSGRMRKDFSAYQNQRPVLYNFENKTYINWERTDTVDSVIWTGEIDSDGFVAGSCQAVTNKGSASNGIFFNFKNNLYISWFDTRRGRESVYFARKDGSYWNEEPLVENKNQNMFIYPLVVADRTDEGGENLAFIFQQGLNKKKNIALLQPDKSVNPPSFTPVSYKKDKKSNKTEVQIQINFPEDSSNIAGYSYTWSKGVPEDSPKQLLYFVRENKLKMKAFSGDGDYYLNARVQDYAGNWSECASIKYTLDTTPPEAPQFDFENLDKYGFVNSNTYSLSWKKSSSDDAISYVYKVEFLADLPKNLRSSKRHPLKRNVETVKSELETLEKKYEKVISRQRKLNKSQNSTVKLFTKKYYAQDNGIYLLSVAAIDDAGNIGSTNSKIFFLNKFEPSTYISSIKLTTNDVGEQFLTILGGGFTYDGTINKIFIDKDGVEPYDLVLERSENHFKVQNDKRISDVKLGSDLAEGNYKIGLYHTDRGLYVTGNILKIEQNGTVKIETDFQLPERYSDEFKQYKYKLTIYSVLLVLIISLLFFILVFITHYVKFAVYEKTQTAKEIDILISGASMAQKKKKEHLPSLRRKLIIFTYLLIMVIIVAVSIQNGLNTVKLQKNTMALALQNRSEVLLESLSSGVKNFFPSNNILELTALPSQKEAMEEVKYISIIGQKLEDSSAENLKYIWATNDPDIDSKMDTFELNYGVSQITEEKILEITSKMPELDNRIGKEVNALSVKVDELAEQARIIGISDIEKLEVISSQQADLRNKIDEILNRYAKESAGSYPYFNPDNLDMENTDYIFYRPVTYRKGQSGNYVHGLVYLELSTENLVSAVHQETLNIVKNGVLIALAALILGALAASLFASFIVKPIKKLEQYVIKIGQTKNKKDLKKQGDIKIKTKDEVERLGNAVNLMAHELINNEIENDLLMDGSSVQNAFLPLVKGTTYSEYDDSIIQCYGYYQAQTGVSGDFFDYRKLDDFWYGFIKSDASGHGAPAALIVTVVATIYTEYFKNWSFKKNGTKINTVVNQINDFISNLNLSGKFATLMVGLFNHRTGELYLCNAGDNIVHIYEASTHKVKTITLANTPTAGVFSTDMVDMRGGFKVEKQILNHGDVLFLYTDGIEESTRRVRFADFTVQKTETKSTRMNTETHQMEEFVKIEDKKEEFGPERVCAIIESVFNKQKYELTKEENPMPAEKLEFDFTGCKGSLEDVIFALASMEKVFRLYKPENQVTLEDYIRIDRKIDEFMSLYFNRYDYYSKDKVEIQGLKQYFDYNFMREDEQSDDLTLLALKRL